MKSINLPADVREVLGKKVDHLRREGKVPAELYGQGTENKSLEIDKKVLKEFLKQGGASNLVDLELGQDKPIKVLVQDIQKDVITGEPIHIDLLQINMKEKITTNVALEFVGVSRAVKELGGILVKNLSKVSIECLPKFLVDMIKVNIDKLETIEDKLKVKDLVIPEGIVIKDKVDLVVVNVQPPRTEEELKALDEKVEDKVDEVEGVDKEKEEGAEDETETKNEDEKEDIKEDAKSFSGEEDKK